MPLGSNEKPAYSWALTAHSLTLLQHTECSIFSRRPIVGEKMLSKSLLHRQISNKLFFKINLSSTAAMRTNMIIKDKEKKKSTDIHLACLTDLLLISPDLAEIIYNTKLYTLQLLPDLQTHLGTPKKNTLFITTTLWFRKKMCCALS